MLTVIAGLPALVMFRDWPNGKPKIRRAIPSVGWTERLVSIARGGLVTPLTRRIARSREGSPVVSLPRTTAATSCSLPAPSPERNTTETAASGLAAPGEAGRGAFESSSSSSSPSPSGVPEWDTTWRLVAIRTESPSTLITNPVPVPWLLPSLTLTKTVASLARRIASCGLTASYGCCGGAEG